MIYSNLESLGFDVFFNLLRPVGHDGDRTENECRLENVSSLGSVGENQTKGLQGFP